MLHAESIAALGEIARETNAIDLALGTPEDTVDDELIVAVANGMRLGLNQYSTPVGIPELVTALKVRYSSITPQRADDELGVCTTCGATEAITCALMANLHVGDEVILIEPFYDGYPRIIRRLGAVPRMVPLIRPNWELDISALAAAVNDRTRAIIVNSPHNPTGKIFTRSELASIGDTLGSRSIICISDEVYDEFFYRGKRATSPAEIDSLYSRTLRIGSISKMFGVTGWRLGWAVGPPELIRPVVDCHLAVTAAAPTPIQYAAAVAMGHSEDYFDRRRYLYSQRRNLLSSALAELDFMPSSCDGAFYLTAQLPHIVPREDVLSWFIQQVGIAVVPLRLFTFQDEAADWVRFAFCKSEKKLEQAIERLRRALT